MNDAEDGPEGAGAGVGDGTGAGEQEPVGSVGEEAAKLLGALSEWARDQGTDYAGTAAGAAGAFANAVQDVNEHVATGARTAATARCARSSTSSGTPAPRCATHLAVAASSLMHAAAGLLATNTAEHPKPSTVEKIDLDDGAGWDEDQ